MAGIKPTEKTMFAAMLLEGDDDRFCTDDPVAYLLRMDARTAHVAQHGAHCGEVDEAAEVWQAASDEDKQAMAAETARFWAEEEPDLLAQFGVRTNTC